MQTDNRDKCLKYVDMPRTFHHKANDINLTAKQHIRTCEKLARHYSSKKSNNPKEFEQDEWMKAFILKSADLNEKTLDLLTYMAEFLTETAVDATMLIEGAKIQDIIKDQSDAILMLQNTRDQLIKDLYDIRKNKGVTE